MSRKIGHTEAQYRKWIKEGRGTGEYQDYKPWLTVYDAPSDGRVHRVFGYKSKRTHHLLSDLELSMFYLLEWWEDELQVKEHPLDIVSRICLCLTDGEVDSSRYTYYQGFI